MALEQIVPQRDVAADDPALIPKEPDPVERASLDPHSLPIETGTFRPRLAVVQPSQDQPTVRSPESSIARSWGR